MQPFIPTIGLEVHAELLTRSKMFCGCAVVDPTITPPNNSVCPVCEALPGSLPVVNQQAVALGIKVALALQCEVALTSIFARKNYFYPDLPKGYQISQFEQPLAQHGHLPIKTSTGIRQVRVRRVHLEEDTGKLTHVPAGADGTPAYSLVDLNRAGVPLLEIVTEPDLHSVEEALAYAEGLRHLLRYLGVNSGDMEKGAIRFEANLSLAPANADELGTRVEIKNLNSFKAMQRAMTFEIERQTELLSNGGSVRQETLGWDESLGVTVSQRGKEEAHDYRYFPEPDIPALVLEPQWVEELKAEEPELPFVRLERMIADYQLSASQAALLAEEKGIADFFETAAQGKSAGVVRLIANLITGELFARLNESNAGFDEIKVTPAALAGLADAIDRGVVNLSTGREILLQLLREGGDPEQIIAGSGLQQVSDQAFIQRMVDDTLAAHPDEVQAYLAGKQTVLNWLFGKIMYLAAGRANPQIVRVLLEEGLEKRRAG